MISLKIESPTDSLDLGALLNGSEGVQAIAGLTGAGLPPVSVQWSEGAGDGATYRGQRVLSRSIDVPLFISANSRSSLRDLARRLAMILAAPATLRLRDSGGEEWTLDVVRTGGGDFVYGADTDGERELELIVTLRAGQPFWTSTSERTATKTDFSTPSLDITNPGSVDTPLAWEIRGPGKNLKITSPTGARLLWAGSLMNGETLFIDGTTGILRDANGANRYPDLGPSPRFAKAGPGTESWSVEFPEIPPGVVRTNLCANPNASVDLTGWSARTGTIAKDAAGGVRLSQTTTALPNVYAQATYAKVTVTGQSTYVASLSLANATADLSLTAISLQWLDGANTVVGTSTTDYGTARPDRLSIAAAAPANAVSVQVVLRTRVSGGAVTIRNVLIEKAASVGSYFDGNTPDSGTSVYDWTATVGKSTSTLTIVPDRSTARVSYKLKARDWMVV